MPDLTANSFPHGGEATPVDFAATPEAPRTLNSLSVEEISGVGFAILPLLPTELMVLLTRESDMRKRQAYVELLLNVAKELDPTDSRPVKEVLADAMKKIPVVDLSQFSSSLN